MAIPLVASIALPALGRLLAWGGVGIAAGGAAYYFRSELIAGIGTLLLHLALLLVTYTGSIFNFLLENIVVKFPQTLDLLGMKGGIDLVWTGIRDIANIGIIGLFVFLAINIILGAKEFGEKRMIARVLIIAILINFSLLFSKIIIDSTNFAAYQFYRASGLESTQQAANATVGVGQVSATGPGGVADIFIATMGLTTLGDTYELIQKISANPSGGALPALAFGLVGTAFLFAVAGVFLYASFQIIARGVLLIFLMIISPLAFISWLIPSSALSKGWSMWWDALLRAAFFAPLFMMSLWASMVILQNAQASRKGATLGQFLADPSNASAWPAIILLLFSIGLLFVSVRFATSFAGTIGGWGAAASVAGAPFALGNRFLLGPLGRHTWGAAAARRASRLDDAIGDEKKEVARRRLAAELKGEKFDTYKETRHLSSLLGKKSVAEAYAKGSYNMMNTGLAKTIAGGLGVSGFAGGADKKPPNFADYTKGRADDAAKKASETALSKNDAKEALAEQRRDRKEDLHKRREAESAQLSTLERIARQTKEGEKLGDKIRDAKSDQDKAVQNKAAAEEHFKKTGNAVQRQQVMREEDDRIQRAAEAIKTFQSRIDTIDRPIKEAKERLEQAHDDISKFEKRLEDDAGALASKSAENAREVSASLARGPLARAATGVTTLFGGQPVDDQAANKARGLAKKKIKAQAVKARQQADREILDDAGESSANAGEKKS